jgi:hypothetical protein
VDRSLYEKNCIIHDAPSFMGRWFSTPSPSFAVNLESFIVKTVQIQLFQFLPALTCPCFYEENPDVAEIQQVCWLESTFCLHCSGHLGSTKSVRLVAKGIHISFHYTGWFIGIPLDYSNPMSRSPWNIMK